MLVAAVSEALAEALRAYAKQAGNREAEVQFAEIKVRAEISCDGPARGGRGSPCQGARVDAVIHLP